MTRYWITLDGGVRFAMKCIERMKGGEVFVPKIPSMKVTDLARVIAPAAEHKFTGIRPGEKLHETLVAVEEARRTEEFDTYYMIKPDYVFQAIEYLEGKPLPKNFEYTSNGNSDWLSDEQMKEMLNQV